MKNSALVLKSKGKHPEKSKVVVPQVVTDNEKLLPALTMDGTAHLEFSGKQNIYYSKEIIEEARKAFDIDRLKDQKSNEEFLAEGEWQINKLWHSIEALTTHNTLFVVLFLVFIGEILNEIRSKLTRPEFVEWRRRVFHSKHDRYLQQAQQLAKMGDFAKRYASMGKKRLLILDKLRKAEECKTYETLFNDNPIPEEVEDSLPTYEEIKKNPFPDSTDDLEGDLLKEHVDGLITYRRLRAAKIDFVSFDQAYLIAAYKKNAITIKRTSEIFEWLKTKGNRRQQKKWFDHLVMNKMDFPGAETKKIHPRESLNYLLANLLDFRNRTDLNDKAWFATQKSLIDKDLVCQSNKYLKTVARKFGIPLSGKR
jgi:hypothetical protein